MKNGLVRNWMTEKVVTATPVTRIDDARKMMNDAKIRNLVVVEADRLVGIITRSGLLRADISFLDDDAWERKYDLSEKTVGNVMTTQPLTTTPNAALPVVARIMLENKISALPVLDQAQKLVGVITASDLFRVILQELPELNQDIRISDYMSRQVITIDPDATLLDAHRLMGVNRIRSLPVVSNGKLLGLVTRTDLMSADPSRYFEKGQQAIAIRIESVAIEKVMVKNLTVVAAEMPITRAAKLMLENKIRSLPVVSSRGELVGILTESDLFRLIMQKFF